MHYKDFIKINFRNIVYLVTFLCCITFGAHALFGSLLSTKREREVDLELFNEVLSLVKSNYVEEVEDDFLIKKAIDGMLVSLDPNSGFLDEEAFEDLQMKVDGEFGGIGVEITSMYSFLKVISPYYDGPAFRAGIREDDYIIKVNSESIQGMKIMEAIKLIRGEPGTDVNLTIFRESTRETFEVDIVREIVEIDPARSSIIDDHILHISVARFSEGTAERVKEIIEDVSERFDSIEGIILDFRWNPGGLINEAYDLANLFLTEGVVVSVKGRAENDKVVYNASGKDITEGLPIIILINGGSASASEIVAAALRDHLRAVTIGTKSFGKGSVQIVIPFAENYGIKMTTALYYTPNGVAIQESKGIIPDIEVPFKLIELGEDDPIEEALKMEDEEEKHVTQKHETEAKKSTFIKDNQLLRAIDLMKDVVIYKSIVEGR